VRYTLEEGCTLLSVAGRVDTPKKRIPHYHKAAKAGFVLAYIRLHLAP
jgi:hypothetical protein